MIELQVSKAHIMPYALHQEIEALIGSKLVGVSHNGQEVRVHLTDETTSGEQAQATTAVNDHSPAILSHTRSGDTVTVTIWLPYDDAATEVTLEADGIALPAATALSVDQEGGKSGGEDIVDAEAFVVTVQGYAHTSMHVEAE